MNQQVRDGWERFPHRLLGAIGLRSDTYRALADAPSALPQAIAVILLGSLASVIVALVDGASPSLSVDVDWDRFALTRDSSLRAALAGGILDAGWGLLVWGAQALIIWWLWNRFSRRQRAWRSVAVPLGFANAPLIVFGLLELVPTVGGLLAGVGLAWTLVASLVALRAALEVGWGRSLLLLLTSTVVLVPLSLLLNRVS